MASIPSRARRVRRLWAHALILALAAPALATGQPAMLAGGEYYVDRDPGTGSATALTARDGRFDAALEDLEFQVHTAALAAGAHVLYLRLRDADGTWGRPRAATIAVARAGSAPSPPAAGIAAAEYFVDRDPGPGRGAALAAQDGAFGGDTEGASLHVSTEGLAAGYHVLYVRLRDQDGTWGRPRATFFEVSRLPDTTAAEHAIAAAEYFVGRDPGQGSGVALEPVDGAWGGGLEEVIGRLESAGLSIGAHTVSVRLRDSSGLWGRTRSVPFTVEPPPPERPDLVVDDAGPHDFGGLRIGTSAEWTLTVSLSFAYEIGGTRHPATVSGVPAHLAAAYAGAGLAVTWDTETDLPGRDELVRFVISVADAEHAEGNLAVTSGFRVDNNQPPAAELTALAGPVGRLVEIESALTDAEQDPLSLAAAYSTDGGASWRPATLASPTIEVVRYAQSVLWDTFADLGHGRVSTLFRLTPSDNDQGVAGQVPVQVVNLAADYDGDQDIDFDDLVVFLVAWNRIPPDVSVDIGPASGVPPDLLPTGDGALDFEDVVVLLQMWNWSAGIFPTGKLALASQGQGAVEISTAGDHGHLLLDLRLATTVALAARFDVEYDPEAWELLAVGPVEGMANPGQLLVLWRQSAPGHVRLEVGSLRGILHGPGALVRLRFAAAGAGGDDMRVAYDLRDGAGLPHAAGAVGVHVRPTPSRSFLSPNVPNPFNPEALIAYGLAEPSQVELVVYDAGGRRVRRLVPQGWQPGGYYRVVWDGRDDSGQSVGSGVYLYRLRVEGAGDPRALVQTRRMLLLR
ncbi:MAG: FlgD immunoglobulin-like domain containing protein [Candidatus Latescibacterota bacterium]